MTTHFRDLIQLVRDQDEGELVASYLDELQLGDELRENILAQACQWIQEVQSQPIKNFNIQKLLQACPLSSREGKSLMILIEALERIPDRFTTKMLVEDKLAELEKIKNKDFFKGGGLHRLSRIGFGLHDFMSKTGFGKSLSWAWDPLFLFAVKQLIRYVSQGFIAGSTIEKAYKKCQHNTHDFYSFDMLGEGARTWAQANEFKKAYEAAIAYLAQQTKEKQGNIWQKDSISIKLSALHPHFNVAHHHDCKEQLSRILLELCLQAKEGGIAITIDAEECARLALSLDIITAVLQDKVLKGWEGFGLAVQAYTKMAGSVIDWVQELSQSSKQKLAVRLVKGAYWDTEIKIAQVGGFKSYPVFTQKPATDISYLFCAQKMLNSKGWLFPQFATHNAYTIAAVLNLSQNLTGMEFQRLYGMGTELYTAVRQQYDVTCRVYTPVGDYKHLLPYLVRRFLENGANTSFVNKIYDDSLSVAEIAADPFIFYQKYKPGINPAIPLPESLFGERRKNSQGYDLNDYGTLESLASIMQDQKRDPYLAIKSKKSEVRAIYSPSNQKMVVGEVEETLADDVPQMLEIASQACRLWDQKPVGERADILLKAADLLEQQKGLLLHLLIHEAGRTHADAVSELREAVDYCRYYAELAREHLDTRSLPGPTGELNQLSFHGRGVFACISPWNFPLAIFMGQVVAALVTGNAVIAKPASQTPLIAHAAVNILHQAGIPQEVLHYLPMEGSKLGSLLLSDLRVGGVVFTGSTETAQQINQALTTRGGPIVPLIAETGGINAMIVDSSALPEQVIDDVVSSAFQSAGQRCSSLRILCVQEDVYDEIKALLVQAIQELKVGPADLLSSDVGPVIGEIAHNDIEAYITAHKVQLICRTPLDSLGSKGYFVAPTLIEVKGVHELHREVFGPVLHLCSYKAEVLEELIHQINATGYGLTMGIHSRIDSLVEKVRSLAQVGNLYVNRNIIGAVVGSQPFGGEGLSGTGPKAGGPHYLYRFVIERAYTENLTAKGGNLDLLIE